jgi:hypothetical protein
MNLYRVSTESNPSLLKDSNYRPQFGSFELKLLKIWKFFKYINYLLAKRRMIAYFRKNMSKMPVDNGSSLNIPITKIINALTNITLIETSVLVVYP